MVARSNRQTYFNLSRYNGLLLHRETQKNKNQHMLGDRRCVILRSARVRRNIITGAEFDQMCRILFRVAPRANLGGRNITETKKSKKKQRKTLVMMSFW